MSLSIEDLKPKETKITVRGVELVAKPLTLAQALIISKAATIFSNSADVSREEITQAESDLDAVISEVIPEISFSLDMVTKMELIEKLLESIQPEDNKELKDNGVEVNSNPKV